MGGTAWIHCRATVPTFLTKLPVLPPGSLTCAIFWDTSMGEVAGGKQLTWVEEKPPLGFCWLLIHFAMRDAEASSSWAGAVCEVSWARST